MSLTTLRAIGTNDGIYVSVEDIINLLKTESTIEAVKILELIQLQEASQESEEKKTEAEEQTEKKEDDVEMPDLADFIASSFGIVQNSQDLGDILTRLDEAKNEFFEGLKKAQEKLQKEKKEEDK